jgi:hypothetical protein
MSEVIAELTRLSLGRNRGEVQRSDRGLPVVSVGRPITSEDVRSLEDD